MLRRLKTCGYETCGYCNLTREAIRRCEVRFGALASEAIRRCEVHFGALESEAICHGERFFVAITSEAIFLFDFLPSQGRIKERFPLKRCHTGVFFVVLTSEAIFLFQKRRLRDLRLLPPNYSVNSFSLSKLIKFILEKSFDFKD